MNAKNDRAAWLKGGGVRCAVSAQWQLKPFRLMLLGAPGVGKGTQAELLCEKLGMCHLSTGDIFRAAKCLEPGERSPAVDAAMDYMRRGDLVPDETVLELVSERVRCLRCCGGFLLDGFPRTVPQAESLDGLLVREQLGLTGVVDFELPLENIVARLSGRRTCASCQSVFHVTSRAPQKEGVCDRCGGNLFQREDDRPESIKVRMAAYEESTRPLIEYYKGRGLLHTIPAEGAPEDICRRALTALGAHDFSVRAAQAGYVKGDVQG